jgi:hypothetical protein
VFDTTNNCCSSCQSMRSIAALELFASLLCVMLLAPEDRFDELLFITMSGITDNKGNESLVVKNMTTKLPLYLVLLEITERLHMRRVWLDLTWAPRGLKPSRG